MACEKESGEGGNAMIQGKVYGYDINSNGIVTDSGYVAETNVYLSYGDNPWPDEDEKTSFSGDFAFHNLRKGKYKVYVYSQCDSCLFNKKEVIQVVELKKNSETLTLPDFIIFD
jgi:hypothetical protein